MPEPPTPLTPLPIDPALPDLTEALRGAGSLVVVAPPGSGKTTRLPPALLDSGLLGEGACLVVQPRRLAARAAAARVADERGWQLGGEVGYEVRFDRRASARTKLLFVTGGILAARLQSDPFLEGAAAVVLDEFHERSLEVDLALALLREIRVLRPELKVVVLSATLDPGPVAAYLGAAVRRVEGRAYPVETTYLTRLDPARGAGIPARVAAGVREAWAERPGGRGDVLAFLPGAGEIRKTADLLAAWAEEEAAPVLPLHGDLSLDAQAAVLRRPPGLAGRVILATNVAETSLTVEGVVAVVDSGFAKVLRHEPGLGLDRLELAPVSRASADQRAGRAGRLGPGRAYRLWTAHEQSSRPAETPAEVLRVDLAPACLQLLAWGAEPEAFPWFQRPPDDALAAARSLLRRLGALDGAGRLTEPGAALRRLPVHPRLGRMLLEADHRGHLREGAELAALCAERDVLLGGRAFGEGPAVHAGDSDLLDRLELLHEAERGGFRPDRTRALGLDPGAARAVARVRDQLVSLAGGGRGQERREADPEALLRVVLAGYPDRVARRRAEGKDRFVLVGGRGAVLSERSGVRRAEFIAAARLEAGRRGERSEAVVRWASRVEPEWLAEEQPLERRVEVSFDEAAGRVVAVERELYGDLPVRERPARPPPEDAARLLAEAACRDPERALDPGPAASSLVARCRFLARAAPELGLPAWTPDDWRGVVEPLCRGKTGLEELRRADLAAALRARLTWEQLQALDRLAPERLPVPSGNRPALDYPEAGPPVLAVKIQEVFGWKEGPRVAGGRVPVLLHLLGPHGRPLQVTADLAGFWERTYPEVRKELRGRYPRHHWPEDPWSAPPKLLVKAARRAG